MLPGREKAWLSILLAFFTTPVDYGLLLVDGGLIHYDYRGRGMLAVFGVSFLTAWFVYQRSKYKDQSGEVIADNGEQTHGLGITSGHPVEEPPFYADQYDYYGYRSVETGLLFCRWQLLDGPCAALSCMVFTS